MTSSGQSSMKALFCMLLVFAATTASFAIKPSFAAEFVPFATSQTFDYPGQINTDADGNIYVASRGDHTIKIIAPDETLIRTLGSTSGNADGQFRDPTGVAVDSSKNVYVADTGNNRIQKFSSQGMFLTKWGARGSSDGDFESPEGVAVDASGNVYVVDSPSNNRVQKFDSTGQYITKWSGTLYAPAGITVDASGNVYVANRGGHNIQKFSPTGEQLALWGRMGSGDGNFEMPCGIAVDASGFIYVTDKDLSRIQKLAADGTFITKWARYGSGSGAFRSPWGVAVDTSGNVYVADSGNNRLQILSPSSAPTATLTGAPTAPTPAASATITVAGTDVTQYKYSLDGGAWSTATPIATPLTLTGLTVGSHTLSVVGGTSGDVWQDTSAATTATWTVTMANIVPEIKLLLLN